MKLVAKIAGLCLASVLVAGMALAGNASAAGPLWLLCLEGTNANNTKYEDSSCTKAKSTGAWESVSIGSKRDTIRIAVLTLRLRDKEAGTEVECNSNLEKDEGEGWVGSENKGEITKAKINTAEIGSRCTIIKSPVCKKIEEVHGVNLPWKTEIFETENALITKIAKGGATGEPGWSIKCSGAVDECTSINGEDEEVTLTNVVSGTVLLVKGVFKKAHNAECSLNPGKRAGQVEGLVAILLINKNGLSINKL
jgi:hypothetical protein